MFNFSNIPENSILGINYSGMHDSTIAIVDHSGKPIESELEKLTKKVDVFQKADEERLGLINYGCDFHFTQ